MDKQQKNQAKRIGFGAGGLGSGVVLTWAWNAVFPENQMPSEVGAALGAGLMGLAMWVKSLVEEAV